MQNIEAKLKFLQSPQAYGRKAGPVTCVETHMSWVFLVDGQVFKLKKPVRFPFLDFATLESREFYCSEEVRLNARLAPGVYLGLMALQWTGKGFLLVPQSQLRTDPSSQGQTVDWLVWMRRLPADRMLSQLITRGQVLTQDVDSLVSVLIAFYRNAAAVDITPADYLARFRYDQVANREVLLRPQFQLRDVELAIDQLDITLTRSADLLGDRASRQRILDGHGDLRPEHICLLQTPVVIDCLEFNPKLRQVDPVDEIAYLSLECAMAGAPGVGESILAGCAGALKDQPSRALIHLYTAHRALLRARLAMAHLLDSQPRTPAKWPLQASHYIDRAIAALDSFNAAMPHDWP